MYKRQDNPGQSALGIDIPQGFHVQVRRDESGFLPQNPCVDTEKELGYGERIGKLGSQIVYNQKVTVKDIGIGLLVASVLLL